MVEYNPDFPIEEIERANAAIEKGTAVAWRKVSFPNYYDEMVKHQHDSIDYPQFKADWTFNFYTKRTSGQKGKHIHTYELELKHQNNLTKLKDDMIACYVSKEWVENCDNGSYPRMAYAICVPKHANMFYCNKMKSLIKEAKRQGLIATTNDGKCRILVNLDDFKLCERSLSKRDFATWQFVMENGVRIYGAKQNYFPPPEELSDNPIDKLIEQTKLQISVLEGKMAKLQILKSLADEFGDELGGSLL